MLTAVALVSTASLACAQPSADSKPSLTPPPPAGKSAGELAMWRTSYINETGALPLGATDTAMEYAIGGSFSLTAEGTVRGWMRWEQFAPVSAPEGTSRSVSQLIEVDCRNDRGRLLALDLYPYNNLQGAPQHVDAQDPQWSYARPGTVLDQNIGVLCGAAKSAVTAELMQASAEQGSPAPLRQDPPTTSLASIR